MDKSKVVADLGLITETALAHDLFNPVHLRYSVILDHEIDEEMLIKAWNKVKKVYPIVDTTFKLESGDVELYMDPVFRASHTKDHIFLIKPDSGLNEPIKSKVPIEPGCELVCGRLISVSYYEDKLTLSAYHSLADGGGLNMIFSVLLYIYLSLYTGHEDENPPVDLTENKDINEYYQGATLDYIFSLDYTPVPMYTLPLECKGFYDDDMVKENKSVASCTLNIPVKDFIEFCKKNGANPSSMMCSLLAKASYSLNPDVNDDIVFDLTVSMRKVLGLGKTIANCIGLAAAYTTHDDIMNKSIAEVSQKIRHDIDIQRTWDYYISFRRLFNTYQHKPTYKSKTVTYMGALNIGDNNHHIKELELGTNSIHNLYMMQLNDKFAIILQYGKATEKYMNEFIKIFSDYGIKAEIKQPAHLLMNDSKIPVL